MSQRLVRQPNGLLANFSEVADGFTDYEMTNKQAFDLWRNLAGGKVARDKIQAADANPKRFKEALKIIKAVHGPVEANLLRKYLSRKRKIKK